MEEIPNTKQGLILYLAYCEKQIKENLLLNRRLHSRMKSCQERLEKTKTIKIKEKISMMIPTVGRVVYYKSYGSPCGTYKPEDRAAIITAVHSDTEISLCVLNPEGLFFNRNVIQGQKGGQWDWMPYQKANATNSQSAEPRDSV